MNNKKTYSLFLFLGILLILNNIPLGKCADEYGNALFGERIYANGIQIDYFSNASYSEGMNITVNNYLLKNYVFRTSTWINTTEFSTWVYLYQGVGIQVYDENEDLVYASGIAPNPTLFSGYYEEMEVVVYESDIIVLNTDNTMFNVNVTLWQDYGAEWVMIEGFKFNLVASNYGVEEPVSDTSFIDLWFLGFVLASFITPLSIVGTIKMRNPRLLRITAFGFILWLCCFSVIIGKNPFW